MATDYPTALDAYTRPLVADPMNNPSHAGVHDNAYDAVEAVETKIGIGASTPVANTVLAGTAAGNSSWSAAPRLANIADTDGTNRITTAIASPQITLTGDVVVSNTMAAGGATISTGITLNIQVPVEAGTMRAISGIAAKSLTAARTEFSGLFFAALVAGSYNLSRLQGMEVRVGTTGYSGVVTNARGIYVQPHTWSAVANQTTNLYGIHINTMSSIDSSGTTVCGLCVHHQTGGTFTNRYVIWAGAALTGTPTLKLDEWTAAANQTALYLAEGVTPTPRQVRWKNPGALGVNLLATDMVMVLV